MLNLNPNYVNDEDNNPIAVQISIKTFRKIEEVLENYSLYKLMEQDNSESLELKGAKA